MQSHFQNWEKVTTGERLKELMSERGLKQRDIIENAKPFCKKYDVNITKVDLSHYIANRSEPRQDKLYILAKALNVSEAWLMGFDAPRERREDSRPKIDITDFIQHDGVLIYDGTKIDKEYIEIIKNILKKYK